MVRRKFLSVSAKALAGVAASMLPQFRPCPATAQESAVEGKSPVQEADPNLFVFSRLKFQTIARQANEWDAMPIADESLLRYLSDAVNIKLTPKHWRERVVGIDDFARLYTLPFVFMTGEGDFVWTDEEVKALREFFLRGGFLYADECVDPTGGAYFYNAYLRQIQKILPGSSMEPVPPDNAIYHCFYEIPGGKAPYVAGQRNPDMGLFYESRMVSFLTSIDLHCGWWAGLPSIRHMQVPSFQMGVNIIIYALTH